MQLYCPTCRIHLNAANKCAGCDFSIQEKNGVHIDPAVADERDKEYYDNVYDGELGKKWFQGLNRESLAKRILERVSLSYRRERFFRRAMSGQDNDILDLACGIGRDYFADYGRVVGVDLNYKALDVAKSRYDMVLQSGVATLPFPDNSFDYVVTSDFFGHVLHEDKGAIMDEIFRVLKPGGKTIHIIETDSTNIWFKIAHKDTELFKKYFIEKIGGHIGLEMPTDCVARWKRHGFEIDTAKKIWGLVWPIQDYGRMFGPEYRTQSALIRRVSRMSDILGKHRAVRSLINIVLNPLNSLVETVTPLNHGQGMMLVGVKPKQ